MTTLGISVAVLATVMLLSEAVRRYVARRLPPGGYAGPWLREATSTFQLCCCSHELKLLGEAALLQPALALGLTYSVAFLHLSTFNGAAVNPCSLVERFCRGASSGRVTAALVSAQFAAATVARLFAGSVWSLGLSELHRRQRQFDFQCFDPLGTTLLEAAAVELAGAFIMQAAAMNLHRADRRLRVHCMAAVITGLVYQAGSITGAVFNPVLAFSIQFHCSGHTYLEYCFVYWLGPALGVASCVLLFEKIIPFLSGTRPAGRDVPVDEKRKTQ